VSVKPFVFTPDDAAAMLSAELRERAYWRRRRPSEPDQPDPSRGGAAPGARSASRVTLHQAILDRIAKSEDFTRRTMLSRAMLALEDPIGELEARFPVSYDGALDLVARYGVRTRPVSVVPDRRPDDGDLAERLGIPPGRASGVIRCPAHEDRNPSLSWRRAADGRLLLHDFAGCTFDEIRAATA
jgi:hypothetical protein